MTPKAEALLAEYHERMHGECECDAAFIRGPLLAIEAEARAEQAAEVERLRAAAVEVITETEAVRDAINGSGHPGEDHDHVLGDLLSPHHICDRVADCANCGGAQYGAEDRLNHAMGSLRLAVGMEVRPWEYPDREFAATPEPSRRRNGMTDHRPIDVQVDEQRKTALVDRLQSLSALDAPEALDGVSFITARDIEEVFDSELELDYEHMFTATTPARGLIDMACPACHVVIPDVAVRIWSEQKREEGDGTSKVKLKFKTDAKVHVCGQLPLPKGPVKVEGQTEAFEDDEPDDAPDLDPEDDDA